MDSFSEEQLCLLKEVIENYGQNAEKESVSKVLIEFSKRIIKEVKNNESSQSCANLLADLTEQRLDPLVKLVEEQISKPQPGATRELSAKVLDVIDILVARQKILKALLHFNNAKILQEIVSARLAILDCLNTFSDSEEEQDN